MISFIGSRSARAMEPSEKKAKRGSMPAEMKEMIETKLVGLGEVWRFKRSHKKGAGCVQSRCLPAEDIIHEKAETIRKGSANRPHFVCSNHRCVEPIRTDKWSAHVLEKTSDNFLQEDPETVLRRSCNFAPSAEWDTKASRMERVFNFVEMRHLLALCPKHDEVHLTQRISQANHFNIRLTTVGNRNITRIYCNNTLRHTAFLR